MLGAGAHNPSGMNQFDPHAYSTAFALAAITELLVAVFLATGGDTFPRKDPLRLIIKGTAVGFLALAMLCGWVWVTR